MLLPAVARFRSETLLLVLGFFCASVEALSQTSADSVTLTFRRYASPSVQQYVPGEFNGWSPTAWPMTYGGQYWTLARSFLIHSPQTPFPHALGDSVWQYKFYPPESGTIWPNDPLNPESNPNDNNNSILRLTRLFWFEFFATELNQQFTRITVGLIHANSDTITSIKYSTGTTQNSQLTTFDVKGSYNGETRLLDFNLPSPVDKLDFIKLVAHNNHGDSVVYARGGVVVQLLAIPSYAQHGVTLPTLASGDSTTFRLEVPGKNYIFLRIAPQGQSPQASEPIVMRKNPASNDWWMNLKLNLNMTYEYIYEFENGVKVYDPWGRDVGQYGTKFTVGPAGLTADDHVWQSTNYQRPPLNRLVLYELNVGEFAGGYYGKTNGANQGTFLELASLMGHFDSLGVNGIELMPVNDYGAIGRSGHSWGYDINSYFALEPGYGSPRDFKALVDSAHKHGIAVVVDVVFNHLNETSALWQMQPDEAANPYFKTLPPYNYNEDGLAFFKDMDHWNQQTQELVYSSLKMFIDEYKVDGFRYDYTQGIGWTISDSTVGILGWANKIHNEYGGRIYQIAEHLPESPALIYYSGLTSGWHDSFRDEVFDEARFQNRSLTNIENLVLDLGAYGGNDTPSIPSTYGSRIEPVNATVNHDEQSLIYEMNIFQSVPLATAIQRDKLYGVLMFTSLGIPMLWEGMEFSEPRGWPNESQKLVYRPVDWSLRSTQRGQSHFAHYRALVFHRRFNPALYNGSLQKLARYDTDRVLVWGFDDAATNSKVMIVANFSSSDRTISNVPWLATGNWYDIFDQSVFSVSSSPVPSFFVPAFTAWVFSNRTNAELGILTGVSEGEPAMPTQFALHQNFPNPFNPSTTLTYDVPERNRVNLTVYNILGAVVKTLVDGDQSEGRHSVQWDGRNNHAQPVSSGVYFARLQYGDFANVLKIVLIK